MYIETKTTEKTKTVVGGRIRTLCNTLKWTNSIQTERERVSETEKEIERTEQCKKGKERERETKIQFHRRMWIVHLWYTSRAVCCALAYILNFYSTFSLLATSYCYLFWLLFVVCFLANAVCVLHASACVYLCLCVLSHFAAFYISHLFCSPGWPVALVFDISVRYLFFCPDSFGVCVCSTRKKYMLCISVEAMVYFCT